jgi:hypothetical protein
MQSIFLSAFAALWLIISAKKLFPELIISDQKKYCLLSSFFETAVVYLLKHTSFMLKNKTYNVITVNAAIIIAIVIIICSSPGGLA